MDEDADMGLGEETEARELLLSDPKLWKVRLSHQGDGIRGWGLMECDAVDSGSLCRSWIGGFTIQSDRRTNQESSSVLCPSFPLLLLIVLQTTDRRKCLRHHPDKKASAGGETNDDSFYKCIAKGTSLSPPLKLSN